MKRITIESWEMYLVTFDVIPPTSIYIFLFFVWSLNPPPCRLWLRNAIQAWRERFKSQHHTEPRLWMDKYCHLEQDSEEFPKPLLRMLYFIILCYFQLPFAFCLAIENVLRSKKCFKALFSQDLSEVWTKKISRTLWQPVCRKDWKLGLTTSGRPKSPKKKALRRNVQMHVALINTLSVWDSAQCARHACQFTWHPAAKWSWFVGKATSQGAAREGLALRHEDSWGHFFTCRNLHRIFEVSICSVLQFCRLWCVIELFVFLEMGGSPENLVARISRRCPSASV